MIGADEQYIGAALCGTRSGGSGLDWPRLATIAEKDNVVPALYSVATQPPLRDLVPEEVLAAMRARYYQSCADSALTFQELSNVLGLLSARGIRVVVLKGAALAAKLYASPGARPMGDLDLLVPAERALEAARLLQAAGYRPPLELAPGFGLTYKAQQTYTRRDARAVPVELHSHLFVSAYFRARAPIDWFWQRTAEAEIAGRTALVFTPVAQFLHLCSHYALHHTDRWLLWLYDLALLAEREGSRLDWVELIVAARKFGLAGALSLALADLNAFCRFAIPETVRSRLGAGSGKVEQRVFEAAERGDWSARALWDGLYLPGLAAKARFYSRLLLPGRQYMMSHYHLAHARELPLAYLKRLLMAVKRLE